MALTPGRWLRLLLLLLALLFVGLTPPSQEGRTVLGVFEVIWWSGTDRFFGTAGAGADPDQVLLSRVERVLYRAERRAAMLRHRREVAGYFARVRGDTGTVRTLFEGHVPDAARRVTEQLVQPVRRNLAATGTAGLPVVVVVRTGAGRTDAPAVWSEYAADPAPGTCGVVITLDSLNRYIQGAETSAWLSFCTYLAAFGAPGAGMRAVLDARRWDLARAGVFTGPSRLAPEGELDLGWWRSLLTSWSGDSWWEGRAPAEVGCQLGRPEACLRAFETEDRYAGSWWSSGDAPYWGWYEQGRPLQRVSRDLVPDLVRQFGAAPVRRWWQDDRPVGEGFEAATGEPLGQWLAGYVQRKLGRTLSGPVLRWQSALLALLVCGLAMGLGIFAAQRREVS